MNQANFLSGYKVITMIMVLVITKEKLLGTDFNQENWIIWLKTSQLKKSVFPQSVDFLAKLVLIRDLTSILIKYQYKVFPQIVSTLE